MFSAFRELPSIGVSRHKGDNHRAVTLEIDVKQFSDTGEWGTGGERDYITESIFFVLFLTFLIGEN